MTTRPWGTGNIGAGHGLVYIPLAVMLMITQTTIRASPGSRNGLRSKIGESLQHDAGLPWNLLWQLALEHSAISFQLSAFPLNRRRN